MENRLKDLRKQLGLTQQEFADRLGVKRGAVANYEIGRNIPIDAVISLIVKEFDVNETWLRTGEGDMFLERDEDDALMEWAGTILKDESDSFRRRFIKMLMGLSEDDWDFLAAKAEELVNGK